MKKITFKELNDQEAAKPTPLQVFRSECAKVTGVKEYTVWQWVVGTRRPHKSAIKLLAQHFNCDPDSLFPEKSVMNESEK